MTHHKPLIFLSAIALCLLFIATLFAGDKAQVAVSAATARALKFSHDLHVSQNNMACTDCHAAATTSKSGFDDLLAAHAECAKCHNVDEKNECSLCHLNDNPAPSMRISDYSEKFSHEAHSGAGLECIACHTDLDGKLDIGKTAHLPDMAECMNCHTEKLVSNDCERCHSPGENLKPSNHAVDWVRTHGLAAVDRDIRCVQCHTASSSIPTCEQCHQGDNVVEPQVHPRNYVFRHGQDAHLADIRCATCHEQRDFCAECHNAMNVLPNGHYRAGWLTPSGGTHAEEAEFDLESCMSCHDRPNESPVCATCHTE